ncbi:MAG: TniB family NTP-binding protein [Bacillota bacterium]
MKDIFILSPEEKEIFSKLDECRKQSKYLEEPICMCIYGESGVGKSYLCKNYIKQYPSYDKELDNSIQKIIPALLVRVPPAARGNSIATAILENMGDPFYANGRNTQLKVNRIVNNFKKCNVELLILDEVQHI